jgi:hypothetical protein
MEAIRNGCGQKAIFKNPCGTFAYNRIGITTLIPTSPVKSRTCGDFSMPDGYDLGADFYFYSVISLFRKINGLRY